MQNFLKSKIIIFFGLFGFFFTMILSIFSGTSLLLIFIKSMSGGIILGAIGFGLDIFFQRTLSEEDYKLLFTIEFLSKLKMPGFSNKIPSSENSKPEHKIDLTDDANQNTEAIYQDLYKKDIPDEQAESKIIDAEPTSSYNKIETPPINETVAEADYNVNNKSSTSLHEDISRLNEVHKEEKYKNEGHVKPIGPNGNVSFKLKNKVINADPSIVAKAIKTILQKE